MAEPRADALSAFLLSREAFDGASGLEVVLWARSADMAVRARFSSLEAVMFTPRGADARPNRRAALPLTSLRGAPVDALYFRSQRALIEERARIRASDGLLFESDVKPQERFLMERFITAAFSLSGPNELRDGVLHFDNPSIKAADTRPDLSILSLDIETDGLAGPLLSAAIATRDDGHVFVRGDGQGREGLTFARDETALLRALFEAIRNADPDILAGWNVVDFDLTVLAARSRTLGIPFAIGRGREVARVITSTRPQQVAMARVPGRVVLDGIATLKSATYHFESFTLEHVATELLGRGKRIARGVDAVTEIRRMHAEAPDELAAYNLEDCRLTLDIFGRADLVGFAMERARLTGLAMDRPGGSVAAFDHLYLPRLHRRGFVAPDVRSDAPMVGSPGGHVLDSVPGLYRDVVSFDFRSLYPSIIRTFQIDPLGLFQPGEDPIPAADGATFSRAPAILPGLIETLHEARSQAMAKKNDALSRAIKIVMNSFYGVLGTPGCRFFDPRLPTSITRRGHQVIERARAFFVERRFSVLYGDTDSLFVHFKDVDGEASTKERAQALALELTQTLSEEIRRELGVLSRLELRFESHYLRFLMPTTRGADRGSKKRYAGVVRGADGEIALVVRGLEAVRTDWTPLARRVQRELLLRVFTHERWDGWLLAVSQDLYDGRLDDELVYRKRLRRALAEYPIDGAPPHVRAARMLGPDARRGTAVPYVMTTRGPQPVTHRQAPIDYDHYIASQLAPVCDVVLVPLGTTFETLTGRQGTLFA